MVWGDVQAGQRSEKCSLCSCPTTTEEQFLTWFKINEPILIEYCVQSVGFDRAYIGYAIVHVSIHPWRTRYSSCVLASMGKSAIISTCRFCVDFKLLSPLKKCHGVWLWNHIVRIYSAFKEKTKVSSRVTIPLPIPISSTGSCCWASLFLCDSSQVLRAYPSHEVFNGIVRLL